MFRMPTVEEVAYGAAVLAALAHVPTVAKMFGDVVSFVKGEESKLKAFFVKAKAAVSAAKAEMKK